MVKELVTFLRCQPDTVARLLTQHVPDHHGRCRGCTTPGYGTPSGTWPCTLHWHALQAQRPRQTMPPA